MKNIETKIFTYSTFNRYIEYGISCVLSNIINRNKQIIILCIGSDLVLADSLGPLVGTMLKNKNAPCYIYGTLSATVTAKEIKYARNYIKKLHPESTIIAIDAGLGEEFDVGNIKIQNTGLYPGLGVNKNFDIIGDISVIGVVAKHSEDNKELFKLTRLNLIYKMAEKITDGIMQFLEDKNRNFLLA